MPDPQPLLDEVDVIVATAEAQGRDLTDAECWACEALLSRVDELEEVS